MNINTVDLYELITHEGGKLLYQCDKGIIVCDRDRHTVMSDILDGEFLLGVIKDLSLDGIGHYTLKSAGAANVFLKRLSLHGSTPCSQWVFTGGAAPSFAEHDIRRLEPCHAPLAAEHYGLVSDSLSYIKERIAGGWMWGIFDGGELAGFIGTHDEGAMGMLEIFPNFRRKGYGEVLECFLIKHLLSLGRVPYCHVIDGNDASIALQKKLGLEMADDPAIWLY